MFHKWIISQLTTHLGDKFATGETLFSKDIILIKKIQRKQLIKMVGITVETLESSYLTELWKLSIERKIFTNWVKDNMSLLKRFKIFILDVPMLLNVFFMEILYKTITLLLFIQILMFFLLLLKNLVSVKLTLKIWSKTKK